MLSLTVRSSLSGMTCADARLDLGDQLLGLLDAGARRGAEVQLHQARVCAREEVGADDGDKGQRIGDKPSGEDEHQRAMLQGKVRACRP